MGMDPVVLAESFEALRRHWPRVRPLAALVLGSGWGAVAEGFHPRDALSYRELPALGATGVEGHAGRLLWAGAPDRALWIFQGRRHWYEGVGWTPIAAPVYLARRAGARVLLLTNAAGGIAADWHPGDLMIVRDHIHAMGAHPLIGPHDPFWGPRFPDQCAIYDAELRALLRRAAEAAGVPVREGVYIGVSGPTYETPAEVEAYARWGADAVGMSTTPEAILGNAAGLRVTALSCISNLAAGRGRERLSHDDVARAASAVAPHMTAVLLGFWQRLQEALA